MTLIWAPVGLMPRTCPPYVLAVSRILIRVRRDQRFGVPVRHAAAQKGSHRGNLGAAVADMQVREDALLLVQVGLKDP